MLGNIKEAFVQIEPQGFFSRQGREKIKYDFALNKFSRALKPYAETKLGTPDERAELVNRQNQTKNSSLFRIVSAYKHETGAKIIRAIQVSLNRIDNPIRPSWANRSEIYELTFDPYGILLSIQHGTKFSLDTHEKARDAMMVGVNNLKNIPPSFVEKTSEKTEALQKITSWIKKGSK